MVDIKSLIEDLLKRVEQSSEFETLERKKAREKLLKTLKQSKNEFDFLSQKVGTTPEQMNIVSQLKQIVFKLGDVKTSGK